MARLVLMRPVMTIPRRVLPGATLMITRRCLGRMFLLKPSAATNELFGYILAVAAEKHGILLHAFCLMSNHFHLVLSDPGCKLPAFEQYLDSLVARSFNALYGRWDFFWSSGSYSAVTLLEPADVLDKMAYVLANPVQAGLVQRGAEWPGLWSAPDRIDGAPQTMHRPKHFFRQKGPMPEEAELRLTCPPGFDSVDELRATLTAAVHDREQQVIREFAEQGRSFVGVAAVLAQRHDACPHRPEATRRLDPQVAARDEIKRIEALRLLKDFRLAYRLAFRTFCEGVRKTVFPNGTYWMRVIMGVACAPS